MNPYFKNCTALNGSYRIAVMANNSSTINYKTQATTVLTVTDSNGPIEIVDSIVNYISGTQYDIYVTTNQVLIQPKNWVSNSYGEVEIRLQCQYLDGSDVTWFSTYLYLVPTMLFTASARPSSKIIFKDVVTGYSEDPGYDFEGCEWTANFYSHDQSFYKMYVDNDDSIYYYTYNTSNIKVYDPITGWVDADYKTIIVENDADIPAYATGTAELLKFLSDNTAFHHLGYNFSPTHADGTVNFYFTSGTSLITATNPIPSENGRFILSTGTVSAGLLYETMTPSSPYEDGDDIFYAQAGATINGVLTTLNLCFAFSCIHTRIEWSSSSTEIITPVWTIPPTAQYARYLYVHVTHEVLNVSTSNMPAITNIGTDVTISTSSNPWSQMNNHVGQWMGYVRAPVEGTYSKTYTDGMLIVGSNYYNTSDFPLTLTVISQQESWPVTFNDQTLTATWSTGSVMFTGASTSPTGGVISYTLLSAVDEAGNSVSSFSLMSPMNYIIWASSHVTPQIYTITIQARVAATIQYIETFKTAEITLVVTPSNPVISFSNEAQDFTWSSNGSISFTAPTSSQGSFTYNYGIVSVTDSDANPCNGYFQLINGRIYWGAEAIGSGTPSTLPGETYYINIQATNNATNLYNSVTVTKVITLNFYSGSGWPGVIPATIPYSIPTYISPQWSNYSVNGILYTSDSSVISIMTGSYICGNTVDDALITMYWDGSTDNTYSYSITKRVTVSGGRFELSPTSFTVYELNTSYNVQITEITEPNAIVNLVWISPALSVYDSVQGAWVNGSSSSTTAHVVGSTGMIYIKATASFASTIYMTAGITSPTSTLYPSRQIIISPISTTTVSIPTYNVADNPDVVYNGTTYSANTLNWSGFDPNIMTMSTSTGTYPGSYSLTVTVPYGYKFTNNSTSATVSWSIPKNNITIQATLNGATTATYAYGATVPALGNIVDGNLIDTCMIEYDGNGMTDITESLMATWTPSDTPYSITPRISWASSASADYYNVTYSAASLTIIKGTVTLTWTNPTNGGALQLGDTGTCTVTPSVGGYLYTTSASSIISLSGVRYTANAVGSATLTVIFSGNAYYNAATSSITVNVYELPAPQYTTPFASSNSTYTGSARQLIVMPGNVQTPGATMYYYSNTSGTPGASVTGSTLYTSRTGTDAASYKVWYRISGTDTTAAIPWTQFGTVVISKADNPITWINPTNNNYISLGSGTLSATTPFSATITYSTTASSSVFSISGANYTASAIATQVPITASVASTDNLNAATSTIYVNIDALPTYTAPTKKSNKTYDTNTIAPFNAGSATNGTMYYAIRDTAPIGFDDTSSTPSSMLLKEAGTYHLWYAVKGNSGYKDVNWIELGTFTISKATNSITVSAPSGTISKDNIWHDVSYTTAFKTVCTMTSSNPAIIDTFGTSYRPRGTGQAVLTLTGWATDNFDAVTKTIYLTVS